MRKNCITVVDYGMGNLWSVINALRYLGCDAVVSSNPSVISRAEGLILPGVGSFHKAMNSIRKTGLDQAILESVLGKGKKILGICLGMQLMGLSSPEDQYTTGLGLINTAVDKLSVCGVPRLKIPHVGFDVVHSQPGSQLFKGLSKAADFYFVHSYRMAPLDLIGQLGICRYGEPFLASYERDNIFATQFHPEKSQANGLILLNNFILQ